MNSLEQGETYNPSSANGQAIITNQENLKKNDEITKNLKIAIPNITQDEIDKITKNLKIAFPNITQDEINKQIETLYGFNSSS